MVRKMEDSNKEGEVNMWQSFYGLLRRDLLIAWRHLADLANPLLFFIIVVALFPLGISPAPEMLLSISAGVIWVMALLTTLLSADAMFRSDYDDGSLEQLVLSPASLYLMAIAKVISHWLVTGLPLTILSPVLGVLLYMPAEGIKVLLVSLLLGTITMSFIGAIGAGLTVSLQRGGLLLSLIILPMYIPILIFGTSAVDAAIGGFPYNGQLALLAALALLALSLAPLAIAAAIRINLDR